MAGATARRLLAFVTDIPKQAPATSSAEDEFVAGVRAEIRLLRGYFTKQLRRFRLTRGVVIVSGALVPILAAAPEVPRWILAALGGTTVVTESWAQLFQYRRSFLSAMQTANGLERQLTRYMTSIDPYGRDVPDAFERFAAKVEEIREEAEQSFYETWKDATGILKGQRAEEIKAR